jgi:hypothetical protein
MGMCIRATNMTAKAATFWPRSYSDRRLDHSDRMPILGALMVGASGTIAGLLIVVLISWGFGSLSLITSLLIVGIETVMGLFMGCLMQANQSQDRERSPLPCRAASAGSTGLRPSRP